MTIQDTGIAPVAFNDNGLNDFMAPELRGSVRLILNRPTSTDSVHRKMAYIQSTFECRREDIRMCVRGWWLTDDGEPVNFDTGDDDAIVVRLGPTLRHENMHVMYDGQEFVVEPILNAENSVVFIVDWEAQERRIQEAKANAKYKAESVKHPGRPTL